MRLGSPSCTACSQRWEDVTEEEEGIFQWTKQWYPVVVVDFLDPSRPHAMQLLGKDRAGGAIPWASGCSPELPPAQRDKQKLFDVWTTHTQHCRNCQNALKNINRLTILAYVAAVVCLCLGVIVDARAVAMKVVIVPAGQMPTSFLTFIPPAGFWWVLGGAILFAIVGYLLKKFSRLFYVYEFEHAHND